MKVLVAGAGGAVGVRLVPMLVGAGHEVIAMTRTAAKSELLRGLGAEPAIADGLDRQAVADVVMRAEPDAIVHQMTSIPASTSFRRFDRDFAQTNRLRTEGTRNLLAAAALVGSPRIVAQSFGGWPYVREGGPVKTEADPLDPSPPKGMGETLAAIRALEEDVLGAGGLALRYGLFYGPGTGFALDGELTALVRRRQIPLAGSGAGVWSFCHVDDAAGAAVAALERGGPGVYNVCDDDPAPVATWLPALAEALGAKPPRRVPLWLARPALGAPGVSMMTQIRGASNAKARAELGWEPRWPSWRHGFRDGLDPGLPVPGAAAAGDQAV